MKKLNALRALGVSALFLILSGFLAACSEPFQPSARSINFDNKELSLSLTTNKQERLKVILDAPSSVKVKVTLSLDTTYIDLVLTEDELVFDGGGYRDELDDENEGEYVFADVSSGSDVSSGFSFLVKAKKVTDNEKPATITVKANPGGLTAECKVTVTP